MQDYEVYFEFYGRKMKTTVQARNEQEARKQVSNRIVFHRTELRNDSAPFAGQWDELMDIVNGKK